MSWAEAAAAVGSADGRRGFERLQSWSNWAQAGWNLTNVVGRNSEPQQYQQGDLSSQEQDDIDWEALLQRQNAANDEMCSENGRLRALMDKLHHEVQSLLTTAATTATATAAVTATNAHDNMAAESSDDHEEELIRASLVAAQETLDAWLKVPRNDEGVPVNLGSFYHCGRILQLSQDYHSSEVHCGSPGFQCESCSRFQAAQTYFWEHQHEPGDPDNSDDPPTDLVHREANPIEEEDLFASAASMSAASPPAALAGSAAAVVADHPSSLAAPAASIPPPSLNAEALATAKNSNNNNNSSSSNSSKSPKTSASPGATAKISHSNPASPTSSVLASWGSKVLELVQEALRRGAREDSLSPDEMFAEEEPEQDEMAMLVSEKIRLRELVEEQQERIEALESELQQLDPSQQSLVGGAASSIAAAARNLGVGGLQDAPENALVLGRGMLSSLWKQKAEENRIEVGREYEVIGEKGAVVRNGESLRSDKVADLPPGSFVRVLSKSDKYPRRIEVVAVQTSRHPGNAQEGFTTADEAWGGNTTATPASGSDIGLGDLEVQMPRASQTDDLWGHGSDGADDGYAADGDGEDDATPPPRSTSKEGGRQQQQQQQPKIEQQAVEEEPRLKLKPQAKKPEPIPAAPPIYGWISICLKDGTMLLRPSMRGSGPEECAQTTSDEDVRDVALSSAEWEALKQEHEAYVAGAAALSERLGSATAQLRMAFEMRTVLHEIQLGVRRAFEREEQLLETYKMAREELLLRRQLREARRSCRQQTQATQGSPQIGKEEDEGEEEVNDVDGVEEEALNETFGGSSSSKAVPNNKQGSNSINDSSNNSTSNSNKTEAENRERSTNNSNSNNINNDINNNNNSNNKNNINSNSASFPCGRPPGRLSMTPSASAQASSLDWERLKRELETTKSAVRAGKSRLATLQNEASQQDEDHNACLSTMLQEISRLRTRLRRQMSKSSSSSSKAGGQRPPLDGSPAPSASTEGSPVGAGDVSLWARKLQELKAQSKALKSELGRATASESALRQSVEARTLALRELLRREATSELVVPQCGPLRLPWDPQAERHALRVAVEEQLQTNLRLRKQVRDMASNQALDPSDC